MTRDEMTEIWNRPGVEQGTNLCIWGEDGRSSPGETRNPSNGASATAFMRKVRAGYGPPPPAPYDPSGPLPVPAWLRERYKANCPRNYRELIKGYGVTVTPAERRAERRAELERKGIYLEPERLKPAPPPVEIIEPPAPAALEPQEIAKPIAAIVAAPETIEAPREPAGFTACAWALARPITDRIELAPPRIRRTRAPTKRKAA